MVKKIKNVFHSKFIKSVIVMAFGAVGAQAITLLLSPLITRLYGPEAFGMMGTFNSIINIIGPVSALTFPIAIVLPKGEREVKSIIKLSFNITILFTVISLIIILLFNGLITEILNLQRIANYMYLIPLIVITSGLMQILEQYLIRNNQFSVNAIANFGQSGLINGAKAAIGFIYPHASVLVLLTSLNNGVRALLMLFSSKNFKKLLTIFIKKNNNQKKVAKKYQDFPLYRMPETFLNSLSQALPVLMLTSLFSPAAAGFYTIGRTTLELPTRLIGKAVGYVFYPRITESINNQENPNKLIKKATYSLLFIGVIPFGVVVLFGPQLFSFVFGSEWNVAGEYARWISLWSYARFANRASVRSLPSLNALKLNLIYTIVMVVIGFISLIVGFLVFSDDEIAVAIFGITGSILHFGIIVITLNLSKKFIKSDC